MKQRPSLSPFDRAVRLATPSAVASVIVAAVATNNDSSSALALGIAGGVLTGAALTALLPARAAAPPPPATAPIDAEAAPAGPTPEEIAKAEALDLLRLLPSSIILLDGDGLVAFANPKAEAEVGVALEGAHYSSSLRAPGLVEAVKCAYADATATEFSFTMHRAQERHLAAIVAPLPDHVAAYRVLIFLEDRTRALRAEQLHRDFVANASHELKTPLAAVAGFIETLQVSAKDDPPARDRFLEIMAQEAERMRRLVEDLLSLNRIELNEHVPPLDTVPLRPVLLDAAALATPARADGSRRGSTIEFVPFDRRISVRGDRGELTQLFANLFSNALKYGASKRPVRVEIDHSADRPDTIGVVVQDFGPGIAKEHLPRLTERFYRVDAPSSRAKNGTGLGLAIVKHVLSRHRGELEIESELGRGSRFVAWLPKAAAAEGPDETSGDDPAATDHSAEPGREAAGADRTPAAVDAAQP